MKTKYKHIEFTKLGESDSGKTELWGVYNIGKNEPLGEIRWYNPWRQYCIHIQTAGYAEVILSESCLKDIADFIKQLMEAHKK
jgi:hypothetical protein